MRLRESVAGNGAVRLDTRMDQLRVEPPATGSRRRIPELVLGVLLVAGCALAAVLLSISGRERIPALALSHDIERGHVLTAEDLRVVYVGSDSDLALVREGGEDLIVGRAALSNLAAGTLVTDRQFAAPAEVLDVGGGIVGLALEVGQLPSMQLAPGDQVTVVAGGTTAAEPTEVVAEAAEVVQVEQIQDAAGQPARWWVSLRASESDATELAIATAGDVPVSLVLVER
jgi:SAF domain-containing protein